MRFTISSIIFNSDDNRKHSSTPDHWIFTFEQIEKPRFVNTTTEIVLLADDERVPMWMKAFKKKTDVVFDITVQ